MRRIRKEATKVWHNPEINTFPRRAAGSASRSAGSPNADDRRTQSQHRAALEALFAPKRDPELEAEAKGTAAPLRRRRRQDGSCSRRRLSRIRARGAAEAAQQAADRRGPPQRLQGRRRFPQGRLHAARRPGRTPQTARARRRRASARGDRRALVAPRGELPKRRAVLESRLRRIEEFAEEACTREGARLLRRAVNGRGGAPSTTTPVPAVSVDPSSKPSSEPQ